MWIKSSGEFETKIFGFRKRGGCSFCSRENLIMESGVFRLKNKNTDQALPNFFNQKIDEQNIY